MKIYTRKGDQGKTSLASGERVDKHDRRVALYGMTDELNSTLGLCLGAIDSLPETLERKRLQKELLQQQHILFELGSELAGYKQQADAIQPEDIFFLEASIDAWSEQLETLRNFILPGGDLSAGFLHLARTICRRLERKMSESLALTPESVAASALIYANRLSDYLFVAARSANRLAGKSDVIWKSRSK